MQQCLALQPLPVTACACIACWLVVLTALLLGLLAGCRLHLACLCFFFTEVFAFLHIFLFYITLRFPSFFFFPLIDKVIFSSMPFILHAFILLYLFGRVPSTVRIRSDNKASSVATTTTLNYVWYIDLMLAHKETLSGPKYQNFQNIQKQSQTFFKQFETIIAAEYFKLLITTLKIGFVYSYKLNLSILTFKRCQL